LEVIIELDELLKLGEHLICDLSDCDKDLLYDSDRAGEMFATAVRNSGLTIVSEGNYKFSPHGFTCFLLLAESHASLHAWPEFGYCAVDIFTCNLTLDLYPLVDRLRGMFQSKQITIRNLDRAAFLPLIPAILPANIPLTAATVG
jgi:S-adenosylmethionine decarboxylase